MCCGLPDIRRHIRSSFFDGQHHYWNDDCYSYAGEDSQGAGSDQLVRILEKYKVVEKYTFRGGEMLHFVHCKIVIKSKKGICSYASSSVVLFPELVVPAVLC